MTLASMRQLFDCTAERGYGGPAFNVNNFEEIHEGIRNGARHVNIDTDINLAMSGAMRRDLATDPHDLDPCKSLKEAMLAAKVLCKQRFEQFGCAGHASKIVPIVVDTMAARCVRDGRPRRTA